MPVIRTSRQKKPPDGYADISDTLDEFATKLREAKSSSSKRGDVVSGAGPSASLTHEIFRLNHQRSRYIYELYYKRSAISQELYQWLLKNRFADADLIAKWKKQGFEKLCCLRCISKQETTYGSTCICRVPRKKLDAGAPVSGCVSCGCLGCASTD